MTDTTLIELEEVQEKPAIKNVYNATLSKLKEKLSVITIRASTLHLIIKYVMEAIEETPIKGSEQKEMALKLIRELIVDLTENEDEEVLLKLLNDGTISNMIDLIVDATRGKLNVNVIAAVGSGCFNHCLPYLFSSKPKPKPKKQKKSNSVKITTSA